MAKKLVQVSGAVDYNILQNNGRIAHQVVDHVRTRIKLSWYGGTVANILSLNRFISIWYTQNPDAI